MIAEADGGRCESPEPPGYGASMGRRVLAGVLLCAAGAVAGFVLAERTSNRQTSTTTRTVTQLRTVADHAVGLPSAVAQKHAEILRAAEAGDHDALARLAASNFAYTFGASVAGGPAAYWRKAEQRGERPLEALAAVLTLPYTLSGGIYVWPFAYDKSPDELTPYGENLLNEIPNGGSALGPQGYLGWRAGIRPDGSWIYFVAGD